ncbi:hypothetical protein RJT34_07438 [Clitoria ternatea]|uniref:Uncharacterized protein n=1 Tax=Clitoria ternatea TaxID=43366 RepID=A0AAN9K5B5_CLITE
MTISKDRVKPSPLPDSWKLSEIFATGIILGGYLALMTVIFFYIVYETTFFPSHFGVSHFCNGSDDTVLTNDELKARLGSAVYLQVSTISQALIFVTRSRGWSYANRPGLLLMCAFVIAQLVASVLSATVSWDIIGIRRIGWGWTGIIWLYNTISYVFLDPIKFVVRYALSGRAWNLVVDQRDLSGHDLSNKFFRSTSLIFSRNSFSRGLGTILSATVSWDIIGIRRIGWGWTGII